MYIRKSSRTCNGKTYFNYVLVESVLTPKGPRQKIICSLGDLRPRPRAEWLELAHKLASALSGQHDLLAGQASDPELEQLVAKVNSASPSPRSGQLPQPAAAESNLVAVLIDQVRTEESREAGPVHVGYQFWLRLGVDAILAKAGLSERTRQLSCAMALNRLIHPGSELAMPDWIRSTALPDIFKQAFHQSCLEHPIRRCREMIQMASAGAAQFLLAIKTLLQQGLQLRDRYQEGAVSLHGLAVATGRLDAQLDRLLDGHFRCPDNRRLANHLRHEQPHLFTFLRCPGLDATNNFAERAIRPMAMARKTWGGNRTSNGARTQQIFASVLRTCWQQRKNAFDQLVKLLRSARPILLEIVPAEPSP